MKTIERIAILKQQISVMKDKVIERNGVQERMTSRMFTLLSTEVVLSGVIASPLVAIPYPTTNSGLIFLYIGIIVIVLSLGILLSSYRTTKNWPSPMSESEVKMMNMSANELDALQILYDDYRLTYDVQGKIIDPKARSLNASLLLFIAGVIILIVLKFGG